MKKVFLTVLIPAVILSGCQKADLETTAPGAAALSSGQNAGNAGKAEKKNLPESLSDHRKAEYKEEDYRTGYGSDAVLITGSGTGVEILGEGAAAEDGNVTITEAGDYVLKGIFEGQILVDASKEDLVHLILDGAVIRCESSSAVYGKQSDRIVITLAENSENIVEDGTEYRHDEAGEDEPNGAIFSKDDLVFNGTGKLTVSGNYEDGIRSKDDLMIISGSYEITSAKDALQGKDSVHIADGTFVIRSGKDAVKASNNKDSEKGWVLIDGGTYEVHAADDAFHAETDMVINGGSIRILSSYEGIEGTHVEINGGIIQVASDNDGINAAGGSDPNGEGSSGEDPSGEPQEEKENTWIEVNGGNVFISARGDGMDSNGNLYINGGLVIVEGPEDSENGALDYDGSAYVEGGTVLALGGAGMAVGFHGDSSQASFLYLLEKRQEAGAAVTVRDIGGDEIFSHVPGKKYESVVFSSPDLKYDEEYSLNCGAVTVKIRPVKGY